MARANPDRTLEAILNAKDHAQALDRLTKALGRTWQAAYGFGWRDGVSDAVDDDPPPRVANPYLGGGDRG